MSKNKFSIITINLNNASGLSKTIDSVNRIKNEYIEFIVIDGNSVDGSSVLLQNKIIDKYIVENDEGIYDAMNKGIGLARNDWVIFMNSGDVFAESFNPDIFHEIDNIDNYKLVYGDQMKRGKLLKSFPLFFTELGIIPGSHQSMFFRKPLSYPNEFKIYSDYAVFAQIYKDSPQMVMYINQPISEREPNGISSKISFQKRKEKYMIVFRLFGFIGFFKSLIFSIFFRKYL